MFAVFGVTDKVLMELATKKVQRMPEDKIKSETHRAELVDKALERLLKKKKPVSLTPEFSAPEMAERALQLLTKEPGADCLAVYIRACELGKTKNGKPKVTRNRVQYVTGKQYKTADQLLGGVSNETI